MTLPVPVSAISYIQILSQSHFLSIPSIKTPIWVACNGSQPHYRGYVGPELVELIVDSYPCGLWTLFHTLLAETTLVSENDDVLSRALLLTIRGLSCCLCFLNHCFKTLCSVTFLVWSVAAILWPWRPPLRRKFRGITRSFAPFE